jgi:hypothetical protein
MDIERLRSAVQRDEFLTTMIMSWLAAMSNKTTREIWFREHHLSEVLSLSVQVKGKCSISADPEEDIIRRRSEYLVYAGKEIGIEEAIKDYVRDVWDPSENLLTQHAIKRDFKTWMDFAKTLNIYEKPSYLSRCLNARRLE